MGELASLGCCFPSITFCNAGFVDIYRLNLVLSCTILFPPSMVIERFAGYRYLCLHLWSLSTSDQDLLAFLVSIEKSGVILIDLPLYGTLPFPFVAHNILSLVYMFCAIGYLTLFQSTFCYLSFLYLCRNILL